MFTPSIRTSSFRPVPRARLAVSRLLFPALAALQAIVPGAALADSQGGNRSARATIDFRIVIPPVLRLRTIRQPARIVVTERDVVAGYVAVEGSVEMEIVSNLRAGHSMTIQVAGDVVSAVDIQGFGAPVHAGREATTVYFPRAAGAATRTTHQLGFRLRLASHVAPGTYDWPVSMTVVPV